MAQSYIDIKTIINNNINKIIEAKGALESNLDFFKTYKSELSKFYLDIIDRVDTIVYNTQVYKNQYAMSAADSIATITDREQKLININLQLKKDKNLVDDINTPIEAIVKLLEHFPTYLSNIITWSTTIYEQISADTLSKYSTLVDKSEIRINMSELTNGEIVGEAPNLYWEGSGVIDILLNLVSKNIQLQFDNGRLTQDTYATVYSTLMAEVIKQGINIVGLGKDNLIKWQASANKDKLDKLQEERLIAETKTFERQLMGFDDNLYIKLMSAQFDGFSAIYSSGMLDNTDLGPLSARELNDMYARVKERATSRKTYKIEDRIDTPRSTIHL